MKNFKTTYSSRYEGVHDMPVYKKAIEIFSISREFVRMVSTDKNLLDLNRSKERIDRISSHLISTSIGLAPNIAMVESSADPLVRLRSLRFLQQETGRLLRYCEQIESRNSQAKAFAKRLKQEISHFRNLQSTWVGRLRELN